MIWSISGYTTPRHTQLSAIEGHLEAAGVEQNHKCSSMKTDRMETLSLDSVGSKN